MTTNLPSVTDVSEPSNGGSLQGVVGPLVIELWPTESECVVCGKFMYGCKQGIPMYEGEPVPHDHTGEWGGFDACLDCWLEYTVAQASPRMLDQWWKDVKSNKRPNAEVSDTKRSHH